MNFVTLKFGIFMVLVFLLYWMLGDRKRKWLLLFASWYFYACWDWRFLSLVIISTALDYIAGIGIHRSEPRFARRLWLGVSLVGNLGILFYFKYTNFFIGSFIDLANSVGWHLSPVTLQITLPVGISFYTFQTLSYSLDIYRRNIKPTTSILDFAVFVAFFPQLVAGPIVRARDFLPQLVSSRRLTSDDFTMGLQRFFYGFVKKAFIGDTIALQLVDPVFRHPEQYSSGTLWLAMLGYAVQIYCDFSGYSSMAIGTAKLLGYELMENFRFPYLARNFSEFWRRWHISMSNFFADYLYVTLGGNRVSKPRLMFNLAFTTFVSGLWHGASWNFVTWGVLHGAFFVFSHLLVGDAKFAQKAAWPKVMIAWLITQTLVIVAWIPFRLTDFSQIASYFSGMIRSSGSERVTITPLLGIAFLLFVFDHLWGWLQEHRANALERIPRWADAAAHVALLVFLVHAVPEGDNPFIYFQF